MRLKDGLFKRKWQAETLILCTVSLLQNITDVLTFQFSIGLNLIIVIYGNKCLFMLIRNFYGVIISLTNENMYSIQMNLALVPQGDTLCKNSVLELMCYSLPFSDLSRVSLAHVYKRIRASFPRKLVPLD